MLRAGVCINCAEKTAALILESGPEEIALSSRARAPAARRSSCTMSGLTTYEIAGFVTLALLLALVLVLLFR
jgi:hypothetical protein